MKAVAVLVVLLGASLVSYSYADLEIFTNSRVYSSGQPLLVFGQAMPDESVIIRVFGPDGTITKFDQVTADASGSFQQVILTWPEASITFPYGTYTIEALSTDQGGVSQTISVRFTTSSELVETPVEQNINMRVFAPETATINDTLRIFVQVTGDGLLVGNDPRDLLRTTHIHLPDGSARDITDSFQTLHQGLFYADYIPEQEGTYVFHAVAFNQGTVSHESAATTVLRQDIGDISEQILNLNTILAETSVELDGLKTEVSEFKATLQQASDNIDSSVGSVSESVGNIEDASSQLNSLFFPVVALIGVIVALQLVTLARSSRMYRK